MAIVVRRYLLIGPSQNDFDMFVGHSSSINANFSPLTVVDVDVDNAVAGAVETLDEFMAQRGWEYSPSSAVSRYGTTLFWGNADVGAAVEDRFLSPGHEFALASLTDVMQIPVSGTGSLKNLYVRHNSAGGDGDSVVYTVMVNGVATAITVTLATGAIGQASDLVNTVAVVAGNRVSLRANKAVDITSGLIDVQVSVDLYREAG